ncbi:DUF2442 domain-containing protein [Paraburkholderia phymatum]|uniref:DUF2442 domain-containing protein n=1 Tax=Paraburkholderia phymatum TaxID=148447 RepID=UPI00317041E5
MHAEAIDVHFESSNVFLHFADGRAVGFPLDWFPLLQVASDRDRANFAISLDHQQLFWPELDEDMNVTALLSLPATWQPWPASFAGSVKCEDA